MNRVGTLGQQFLAIEYYLAVPQRIRDELGADEVWGLIYDKVLSGLTPDVADREFRQMVGYMRDCQRKALEAKDRPARAAANNLCREAEWKVDTFLKENGECEPN